MQIKRIEPGMYRINEYTAFQHEDGSWRIGRLIDNDDFGLGFYYGTVTICRTLRDCKFAVARGLRINRG